MALLGYIAELWRYPVKSMAGEACLSLGIGPSGIDGDRRFAFESADAPIGKPLLRSAQRAAMLRFRAYLDSAGNVTVNVTDGTSMSIADPDLPSSFFSHEPAAGLRLLSDAMPFTDVRPIALHSVASEIALASALGSFDGRRLRSNIILQLAKARPFAEDDLSGTVLRLGRDVELAMLERIPRCRMVSLHPESTVAEPSILRWLAQRREGRLGVYARAIAPGTVSIGDEVHTTT